MTRTSEIGRRACAALLCAVLLCCILLAACQALVWPEASGASVAKKSGTVVDYSHADEGYIMVQQSAGSKRYKLRIVKDKETYTYDLNNDGNFEVFPLQLGTGSYSIKVFKNSSGSKYSTVSSQTIKVKEFTSEYAPFLCPNQYVNYTESTKAVLKSQELCASLTTEAEKLQAVHDWIVQSIRYNYMRALTVEKGYLPDLDEVMDTKLGICFDYAALMACMLRVQGIPTKLMIGYADKTYHSWNEVLVNGEWVRYDTTAEAGNMVVSKYTTERFY